mgnify:CR=1 FL=1
MEEPNKQARGIKEEVDIAEYISQVIYDYIARELGDDIVEAEIEVSFKEDSVEISVDAGASLLVDDEKLKEVVEKAAEVGVAVADMIKEGVIYPGEDRRRVLKEALRRVER